MSRWGAVILAGGHGRRMGTKTPKQFLSLCGKPVIWYSLKAFSDTEAEDLVLVVPTGEAAFCRAEYVEKYGFTKVKAVVEGGRERYDSVYAGLLALRDSPCDYAAVHDGARPLVSPELITRTFRDAEKYGGAAAAVPVKDTIRRADAAQFSAETLPRRELWAMQTPQSFRFSLLLGAYEEMQHHPEKKTDITDDVMVAEEFGKIRVLLTRGEYRNLKITTAEDLAAAEAYLRM